MNKIRVALLGIGNCASSLVQAIGRARGVTALESLTFKTVGGYQVADIEIVCAIDIDRSKVGKPLSQAVFADVNSSKKFCNDLEFCSDVVVSMGVAYDGLGPRSNVEVATDDEASEATLCTLLKTTQVDVLVNLLPVGSQHATEFYARCALASAVNFVNAIPVFIASNPEWSQKFSERNLTIIGDDIKSQLGATIIHRVLAELCKKRGIELTHSYQLNVGGNQDFNNLMDPNRTESKRKSKTNAVLSANDELQKENVGIGPSDYVSWMGDNKVAFTRLEGKHLGGLPWNMEIRLSVEDSPNAAGILIDAIRLVKTGNERGQFGALPIPSAWCCKSPPEQYSDNETYSRLIKSYDACED